jgi:hypothetical protein
MMAKQRKTIGTGITAREVTVYNGIDAILALDETFSRWEALCKTHGGQFGAASRRVIEQCRQIIAGASAPPPNSDVPADFAERILRNYEIAKAAIERNDADMAALAAYYVGVLAGEARLKRQWERHALRGEKNVSTLKEGTHAANKKRSLDAKQRHAAWQAQANEIRARNKSLSTSDVARIIADDTGDNWHTIRRKIFCTK